MARPLRIEYPGALYHVTSRGNARKKIFRDDQDKENFLYRLASVVKRYNWLCHAYCLMDNHYHLMIETPDANLSKGMRQLNGIYTQRYNKRHGKTGHVFQGRFMALLVQKDSYLLELSRYVVLNPVRARIVEYPKDWKWSSYLATAGLIKVPDDVTVDWLLQQFGNNIKTAQERYKEFVQDGIKKRASPWQELQGQILLGDEKFIEEFKDISSGKQQIKEIPRKQRYIGRSTLQDLFGEIKGKNARNRQIYTAHVKFGYTLKEIADCLQIHYTTVSKVIQRREEEGK